MGFAGGCDVLSAGWILAGLRLVSVGDDARSEGVFGLALGRTCSRWRAVDSKGKTELCDVVLHGSSTVRRRRLSRVNRGRRAPDERGVGAVDGRVLDERDRRRSDGLRAREDGLPGSSAAVTISGSGASYTATLASTGTGDGSVGSNLVDNDSIAATSAA